MRPPSTGESAQGSDPEDLDHVMPDARVAIVHDFFTQRGGAERLVAEFARLFPSATVHTSVFDPDSLPDGLGLARVRATPLQGLRRAGVPLSALAPVLPWAFGRMHLDRPQAVISSTSAFAHHIRPPKGVVQVAYWHSPPHFLWEPDEYFRGRSVRRGALAPMLAWLRRADRDAERRVDIALANSRYTADRLARVYARRATVVYPAVGTAGFSPDPERSGRFLVVSRLRRHKRLDLAVEAATRRHWGLDIIGEGPDEAMLRRAAGPSIRFLGRRSDAEVAAAMSRCVALVVPGVEDFGLTMPEVQAAGRPPVAFARGGALEIIDDGETGFTFDRQTVDGLIAAMARALEIELDADALVRSARRFDRVVFDRAIADVMARAVGGDRPR